MKERRKKPSTKYYLTNVNTFASQQLSAFNGNGVAWQQPESVAGHEAK
jgi:hypothetical protein